MEAQLKELIEKIKNDGVASAEAQAQAIIAAAEKKAAGLLAEAAAKADQLVSQAHGEVARREAAARDALKQASRDLLIALEQKILALFQGVLAKTVDSALTPALVESLVLELAKAWVAQGESGVQLVLAGPQAKTLGEGLRAALAKTFKGGIEILPSDRFTKGVRIQGAGSALTLDMSSLALAELLGEGLQPWLAEILREAVS